jgi:hypothetical protein
LRGHHANQLLQNLVRAILSGQHFTQQFCMFDSA